MDLAKRALENAPPKNAVRSSGRAGGRRHEEAGGRGLVVRWSQYPVWIALHDPISSEWAEVRTEACFPSLVEEANRRRKKA